MHIEEKLDVAELHGSSAGSEKGELAVENAVDVRFEKRILYVCKLAFLHRCREIVRPRQLTHATGEESIYVYCQ